MMALSLMFMLGAKFDPFISFKNIVDLDPNGKPLNAPNLEQTLVVFRQCRQNICHHKFTTNQ